MCIFEKACCELTKPGFMLITWVYINNWIPTIVAKISDLSQKGQLLTAKTSKQSNKRHAQGEEKGEKKKT